MRLRRFAPLLLVVLAVCAQFAPALAGRVYRFEDIAGYFEPLWTAAARAMRAGAAPPSATSPAWLGWPTWPVWDRGAWSGQPIVGDPQLGAFYPPNWLWCAMPVLRAYALVAALHALIGGLGMYALARARGASREAAALGGVALGIGGYVVLQVRHIMFVEATAWLPWLVCAGWKYLEGRRPLFLAQAAVCTGLLLLTGGVSMIYYGLWFAAAVLLPRALATDEPAAAQRPPSAPLATDAAAQQMGDADRPPRGSLSGRLRGIAGIAGLSAAGLLGLLAAAPSLFPAAAHGRLSPRALGADEAFAASVAWTGLKYLPSLFLPNLLGQEVRGDYLGGGTQWEIAGYYTGILTFALGLYALARGAPGRRTERIALGSLMAFCVLLAPGAHSPVHHLACRLLPLYSTMRCPPRALFVISLAMPLLAADGLDALAATMSRRGLRPALQRSIIALAPLLVTVDLLVTHRAENPTMTLAAAHHAATPDVVEFLRDHLRPGERYVNDVHLRHDLHNSGLLWDLPNVSGYSSLPLWRYLHLLWISNHGKTYPHARLHDDLAAQGIWNFDSPIVDLLGIRYVLAPRPWDPHAAGFERRFEGAEGIDVWENTQVMPRAFVIARGQCVVASSDGDEGSAALMAKAARDPRGISMHVIERASGQSESSGARALPVQIVEQGGDDLCADESSPGLGYAPAAFRLLSATESEIDVDGAGGLLIVSEPAHPGWRATVDGQLAEVLTADYALIAIKVAPGAHVIRLEMTALPVEAGLGVGAIGWLMIAGVLLRDWRGRRRRGDGDGASRSG